MTTAVISTFTTTTSTTKSPVLLPQEQEQKSEQQKMNDQLFQQFFQSLTSAEPTTAMTEQEQQQQQEWFATSPEWFSAAMGTGQQSVHSTPEIATPQDMFLTSPTTEHVALEKTGFADLDVSAILNFPLFEVPQQQQHQQQQQQPQDTAAPMTAAPEATASGDDLHTALAALATVTQAPALAHQQPVVIPSPPQQQQQQTSPVISVMPTFSARKRKSADMASDFSANSSSSSPLDEAAVKRQKNTDAARRSRMRKAMKMEGLEKRVADLEKTNTTLLLRAAVLESEKSTLLTKEASYEHRIKALEAQLAQAHQSLAGIGSRQ
ncbi:hypothetical protein BDB00DRAFT_808944 [Zychaea mexicana]|uniref:uncharacterized protein n=1 Tax=Zychaea mexicana TaxID=64656 RepID=UPI0022FE0212|nr:uncharacterized protein BDB00DRAFT_808944 [Zychaea mexicana]KAI9496459.1 hypothetical protein BDB00DRAFT_808944 [Zychaea mexicana]